MSRRAKSRSSQHYVGFGLSVGVKPSEYPLLLGAGRFTMSRAQDLRHRSQKVWLLELFLSGQLDVNIAESGWQRFGPRTGILYAPMTPYAERNPKASPCTSVTVFWELGQGLLQKRFGNLHPPFRIIDDLAGRLSMLAEQVADDIAQDGVGGLRAAGRFFQLTALLASGREVGQTIHLEQTEIVSSQLIHEARRFMQEHLDTTVGVRDMARHVGMSASGFAHAYKRLTHRSPMDDLRQMRIDTVKVFLLHNRLTLAQIADRTGFADGFHLSHVFRRMEGVSPRTWLKQHSLA